MEPARGARPHGVPPIQPPAEDPWQGLRFWGPAHWAGVPVPAPRSRSLFAAALAWSPLGLPAALWDSPGGRGGFGAYPFLLLFPSKRAPPPAKSRPPECFALSPLSWMPLLRLAPRPRSAVTCVIYQPGGGDPTPPVCSADFVPPKKSLEPPPGALSRAWTGSSRPLQPLLGVGVRRRGGLGGVSGGC